MRRWSIKNIIREISITLVMIFLISVVLNYIRKPDTYEKLPEISAISIENENVEFKCNKRPLIVHFWATWCPTCKLEAPNINSIKDDIRTITVAVNSGDNNKLKRFMQERGYDYTVVNDQDGKLAKMFGVKGYPTTFIYDKNGKLQFVEVGYSTEMGLRARVGLIE